MKIINSITRRDFVQKTAIGATAWAAAPAINALGANDKINVGFIGTGDRGNYNIGQFRHWPEVNIVAVCDVYEPNLERAKESAGSNPKGYKDFRQLLENKEIQAVCITTPDHWHCLNFIYSCQAGKDVYIDKPLSVTITEGRAMVNAARKFNIVSQVGSEQHSAPHYIEAVKYIHSGALGAISMVKCWNYDNQAPQGIGNPADEDPPKGLDWDLWLGPAPKVPFNKNRFLFNYRWFWDYSGGFLADWGVHHMDIILWALKERAPKTAMVQGGKFVLHDNRQTPDTFQATWEIGKNTLVLFTHRMGNRRGENGHGYGIEFYGTEGTLYIDRAGYEVFPETRDGKSRCEVSKGSGINGDTHEYPHIRNFLDCVKSRQRCVCDIEWGHRATSVPLIGNLSYFTKQKVEWDAEKEQVTNVAEANQYLFKEYRAPWSYREWL